MKQKSLLMRKSRFFLVLLVIVTLMCPSVIESPSSFSTVKSSDQHLVSGFSKQVEIPAGSGYVIKFDSLNLTLVEQDGKPYSHGLSETIIAAIAKSPIWIQHALTRQFHTLSNPEMYASVLLNSSTRYADEIAFSIACCPGGKVPSAALLKENADSLYEHDQWISYADIVDYNDGAGGYYSTIRYQVLENGTDQCFMLPPLIYYWYVVHPKITMEAVDATYGPLWRDYLFEHNDLGYPLLKEKLSTIQYLWDSASYYQPGGRLWNTCINEHPTAIEAVSYWIGKTVPYPAAGDRPGEPCVIAHEHNGWCGELQQIAIAAQRAALIPAVGANNVGEDHVWREFYERGWHENDNWWSDTGGAVDEPDTYAYGWGKNMSAVYQWRGDDTIREDTSRYIHQEDCITVNFTVKDSFLQPVDGARVTVLVKGPKDITWYKDYFWGKLQGIWDALPDVVKGKLLALLFTKFKQRYDQLPDVINGVTPTIWNYTDLHGHCSFQLGKNQEYVFVIQQGNLKKPWQLARHNTMRRLTSHADKEFTVVLFDVSQRPLRMSKQDIPVGDCQFSVSFSCSAYQLQENFYTGGVGAQNVSGAVDCFFVDEKNYELYTAGKRFICYNFIETGSSDVVVAARSQDWFLVFRNQGRSTNVLLTVSIQVEMPTGDASVDIVTPETSLFAVPRVNVGDSVVLSGVATGRVVVMVGSQTATVEPVNGVWFIVWDTSEATCGQLYHISASCEGATDEQMVYVQDGFPPAVGITQPAAGDILSSSTMVIAGYSSDNDAVDHVDVQLDEGAWIQVNGTNNWSISWDMTGISVGDHTVTARAVDINGFSSTRMVAFVLNETGHSWGPQINSLYHLPGNATNTSNMIVYANVMISSPFALKSLVLFCNNGTDTVSYEMYRYGDFPPQSRHEEDPLINQSNAPIFGVELGQFSTGETITYWVVAIDSAQNKKQSDSASFTII